MLLRLFLLCSCTFLLFLSGCKDDDVPPPPDPCKDAKPTSADFVTGYGLNGIDNDKDFGAGIPWITLDTFITPTYVVFKALDEDALEYKWKVGNDPKIQTKKEFYLSFDQPYGKLDVTLMIRRKPDTKCFPEDDGLDTVRKSIYFLDRSKLPLLGKYEGYSDHDSATHYTIQIDTLGNHTPYLYPSGVALFNLINDQNYCINPGNVSGSSYVFFFNALRTAKQPCTESYIVGEGALSTDRNHITIRYRRRDWDGVNFIDSHRTFFGTRKR